MRRARAMAGVAASILPLLACCVAAPEPKDWIAIGFRTPEQTFATFQTAVRADEPGLEYRCLSSQFVARNGLSNLAYREFRQELRRQNPLLRKGLADAELETAPVIDGDRARVVARSYGRRIAFELVREDSAQIWSGNELVVDDATPFRRSTGTQRAEDGRTWIYGRLPLPEGRHASDATEIRFAREWKIDGIESLGEASEAQGSEPPHEP